MATDIIARGMAANAKKSVTELGDKVESEKWIGTKAEWEAVDKSTIKDGTIVYITDDETVILYDKVEMEKIAAQVAADRKAAETAAQTAQAVADSLPDDYVTAVAKIAENTAEIGRVKLTDKELQRRVNALYSIGQGVTHRFETDSDTAYQKTVPTGAKLMSVKSIGGHSEVIDGEIVSVGTENVVVQGANLWDEVWEIGTISSSSGNNEGSTVTIYSENYTPIIPNSTYIFVYVGSAKFENVKTRFYDHDKKYIGYNDNNGQTVYPNKSFITPSNAFYVRFTLPPDYGNVYKNDIALIAGSSGIYTPYHSNVYQIPEAIRNLPGYGWSAGTARNYVDYENKRYVQCVQSVDLGTLSWRVGDSVSFKTFQLTGQKLTKNYDIAPNILCSKYPTKTQNELWGKINVTGITTAANVDGYVYLNDTAYTDAAAFQQAMQGVMLYYELESPIVTDISTLIPDDFLRNIEVEAGGSITFKGGNDDYRIPVPSEEEYIVKLSEVGGSV